MSLRAALALSALCVAAATAGVSAYRFWQAEPTAANQTRPDLQFKDADGQTRKLSEWDGQLLLLNFWATWCTPCLKEIPLLIETQKTHQARGLQIVGLAPEPPEAVRRFRERLGIQYPLLVGDADILSAMDALGDTLGAFPFSVLIGRDGKILARVSGDLSREELQELLTEHL